MAKLRECPFCGGESETHRRRSSCRFFADSKKAIPKNGRLERTIEYPDGHKRYEYSKAEWVPRCMDSSCIGRVTKAFPSEEEAIEAWNRRANDGQHS